MRSTNYVPDAWPRAVSIIPLSPTITPSRRQNILLSFTLLKRKLKLREVSDLLRVIQFVTGRVTMPLNLNLAVQTCLVTKHRLEGLRLSNWAS